MESFTHFLDVVRSWVWGKPLLILLLGTGLYLTYVLRGVQFRYLKYAIVQVFSASKQGAKGDITHFEALMTTLAGAIGTGSIVGVSTALAIGGLGSLFWMWVTAILSMATKYAECMLAVKYREVDHRGEMIGGPMEYIEKGLKWKGMALTFAAIGAVAAFGSGNLVQVNSISSSVSSIIAINPWLTGVILSGLVAVVILGGVKSIGSVASYLVPAMALFYFFGGCIILALNYAHIPHAFATIFTEAFTGKSILGGAAGGGLIMTIQLGVARSVFTNESGMGIPAIAAAAAITDSPARQGLISMTGALVSTLIVSTITGLVLAVTGVLDGHTSSANGVSMAINAFNTSLPGGKYIVIIGLILFAYSTIIAWAYYGEKCMEYLLGEKAVIYYRIIFSLVVIPAAVMNVDMAWFAADILNGIMVVPNLIALIALSGVISSETKKFLAAQVK